MEEFFVDTNIFLRFLTKDDPKKAEQARSLFEKGMKGDITLKTSELVIAEIVWTLESFYEIPRNEIHEKIQILLQSRGLQIPHHTLLSQALTYYKDLNVDFIDAYNAVWAQEHSIRRFISYDRKHMKRFEFLQIEEP